ncbi:MAG: Fis family transcriptional regulator [Frankiales bacterium]|nr:Fis family transcriptional regulator [Frankiales bacterium]
MPERLLPDAGGRTLAQARQRFLTVDPFEPEGVRQAILASWWRSRDSKVAADHLQTVYVRDPELDTPLTRSAEPVLRHLADQLDGQPVSIVLTDAAGVVLSRITADAALERQLDRVNLAPGFCYAEGVVGTNGIGTALEAGRAMHVFGHEHYAENLEQLACAGVPIKHPMSGKTVGVLDLTCWRRDAGPLLVTLAKTTAEQIRQALLTETGMQEIELLNAYLRACRHSSGMVFALNNDVVMMNETARSTLADGDQASLLRHAAEALASKSSTSTVELPSGIQVRLATRAVHGAGRVAGGVVDVRVVSGAEVTSAPPIHRMLLPGLVGTGTLWRRACLEAESVHRAGGWLVLEGEEGSGKLALVRALHQRVDPGGRSGVVDGAECAVDQARWLDEARRTVAGDGTIIVRHLDRVPAVPLRALVAALQDTAGRPGPWVAVLTREGETGPDLTRLLQLCPTTVHVPPLRHHVEDVQQLVPFLLQRLGAGQLTCSPEAMQVLLRSHWPGNVAQLLEVLRHVLRHRRTGTVLLTDLPPAVQSLNRRRLSTMESLERDAIVLGLQDVGGNKAQAARSLGMSRATIYRKIHDYGISSQTS